MAQADPETDGKARKTDVTEAMVRPSINLLMLRHAESGNNQVYRDARYIFRGGTPEYDEEGWLHYVDTHRRADPELSDVGTRQAEHLSRYLIPHLANQASFPVRIVTSPMKRTLKTIQPTLEKLHNLPSINHTHKCQVIVNAYYHESEGCHSRDKAEEGMNPDEIKDLLKGSFSEELPPEFVGFPNPQRGWYVNGKGAETRAESEARAAKFFLWLCEYLDEQLENPEEDVFDAGVSIPGEESECENDKLSPRKRRRRTAILVGHADFMSLVLKRIISGFGHWVETEGISHRSAFVHHNTGITELEYFGRGRFLLMASNQTPHFRPEDYADLRSGGSLKDGWSYIVPNDEFVLDQEVSVAFNDEVEEHIKEQAEALKSLYLSSENTDLQLRGSNLTIEEEASDAAVQAGKVHFIVKRGLQVVGVATYSEGSGQLTDVAVRPSGGKEVAQALFDSVKSHAKKVGRSGSLLVHPRSSESRTLFEAIGFQQLDEEDEKPVHETPLELKH